MTFLLNKADVKKEVDFYCSDDVDVQHPHEAHPARYFDPTFNHYAIKVLPGAHYVTARRDEMLVTVLGSCVTACIRDTALGIGGMNHFMLPSSDDGKWGQANAAMRFGNHAMETLINDILKLGGAKNRLEIKVFGGGHVLNSRNDIGEKNSKFIIHYLENEHLAPTATNLGGECARRVHFFPKSGKVKMKLLPKTNVGRLIQEENQLISRIEHQEIEGSVDLF